MSLIDYSSANSAEFSLRISCHSPILSGNFHRSPFPIVYPSSWLGGVRECRLRSTAAGSIPSRATEAEKESDVSNWEGPVRSKPYQERPLVLADAGHEMVISSDPHGPVTAPIWG
ncbi:hypothetical protein KIN20_035308 [Parelaphostrongylus tenuis]|uniref:Uncharacterized protein n=1 Tax=Parelaphostrongylus tenuis TaxID=148309 RepID=A0AAD5RBD1_PARTN|nr:hypothetical protein KIN20_035308 [Parelaphostrongylus tenuis]